MVSRKRVFGLAVVLTIAMLSSLLFAYAPLPPAWWLEKRRSAYVDEMWYKIITSADAARNSLITHESDVGGMRPVDIPVLMSHGFSITKVWRIGQTFTFQNNYVWPFGVPVGDVDDPWFDEAVAFRKATNRLINVDEIVSTIYTNPVIGMATMSKAERYLPPGQEAWTAMGQTYTYGVAPDVYSPPWAPLDAASILDAAGFLQADGLGGRPHADNPDYDNTYPGSAEHLRIDPKTNAVLPAFQYYAIGPAESPLGFSMAQLISGWFKKAGLPNDLIAGTWLGLVAKLEDPTLTAFQFMTGIGIIWGTTAPDILYDFTYSENLPVWNFARMNFSKPGPDALDRDADYWCVQMMTTLDVDWVKKASFEIQECLIRYEPYKPLLLWNLFTGTAGNDDPLVPGYEDGKGGIRIANMPGEGFGTAWNRQRMWCGRTNVAGRPINIWIQGSHLSGLNPLEANTAPDWDCVLENVMGGFWRYTPLKRFYWYWGVENPQTSAPWIGPGSSKAMEGNGVYDAPVTYDASGELATYDGKAVADVTAADLHGDDVIGMVTTWDLRDDMYWQDSDPGPDGRHGTGDEPVGSVYKVTTADMEFCARLMMGLAGAAGSPADLYENVRYFSIWEWFAGYVNGRSASPPQFAIKVVDAAEGVFKLYEERRYVFGFESHDIIALAAKHIFEPYINANGDPKTWRGWESQYMLDPVRERLGLSSKYLTYLIGFGPFVYHYGGFDPGVSTRIEYDPLYYAGKINEGDVDIETFYDSSLPHGYQRYGVVDMADYNKIITAREHGPWPGNMPKDNVWDPTADLGWPSQEVTGVVEISIWYSNLGKAWGPGYPPPP